MTMKKTDSEIIRERVTLRHEALRRVASSQGLVVVQVSDRRHMVVRLNQTSSGLYGGPPGTGVEGQRTWLKGELVFGPAAWDKCHEYLQTAASPLPPELREPPG